MDSLDQVRVDVTILALLLHEHAASPRSFGSFYSVLFYSFLHIDPVYILLIYHNFIISCIYIINICC